MMTLILMNVKQPDTWWSHSLGG